jgi:hypothetical protein
MDESGEANTDAAADVATPAGETEPMTSRGARSATGGRAVERPDTRRGERSDARRDERRACGPAVRLAGALVAAALVAACGRPSGDFGRAEPDVIHDSLMPAAGSLVADKLRHEPVSRFNGTDREALLRDRAYGLVMPPHVGDWIAESAVEWQRTRVLPAMDRRFDARTYYTFLRRDSFASSETRWSRLVADMAADRALVGPFWEVARAVIDDDRRRLQALDARHGGTAAELSDAYARIDENARVVDWVWRSLRLRAIAYRGAIERMAVETPSLRRGEADAALADLERAIAVAESGATPPGRPAGGAARTGATAGGATAGGARQSRMLTPVAPVFPSAR